MRDRLLSLRIISLVILSLAVIYFAFTQTSTMPIQYTMSYESDGVNSEPTAGKAAPSAELIEPLNEQLLISAAASLKDVLQEIAEIYKSHTPGVAISFNFGASGTLQRQIEQGAPADIFISASPKQMDALESKGMILSESRTDILQNRLVLVIPANADKPASFESLFTVNRLALGDPASVPAGQYGEQVLNTFGLLDLLKAEGKIVLGSDVRTVLNWVETGNADAGIVYATDAFTTEEVRIVESAPEVSHDPIIYPAAVLAKSAGIEIALDFLNFLFSSDAAELFRQYGFTPLNEN